MFIALKVAHVFISVESTKTHISDEAPDTNIPHNPEKNVHTWSLPFFKCRENVSNCESLTIMYSLSQKVAPQKATDVVVVGHVQRGRRVNK